MIYTLTLNPAIDLFIKMNELLPKKVNRSIYDDCQENGKGVNVSRALKRMGIDTVAMGFIAGFTGNFIKDKLEEAGIGTDFIQVDGITRINVFLNAQEEFKIVNKGPEIPLEKTKEMLEKIKNLKKDDYLFVCGSLPRGIEDNIYEDIIKICKEKEIKLILDTSSKKIMEYIKYGLYLIKPNDEELAEFFEISHKLSENEIVDCGKKLLEMGCEKIIVSRGEEGAIYFDKENIIFVNAPKGEVVNTACSGDTFLASFIGKLCQNFSLEETIKFASASASSTAFTEGITDFKNVPELMKEITIRKIKLNN